MNVSNLKTIFGGCITATNIIRDQIEDRNDVAVWYLSAGEVPVTPAGGIERWMVGARALDPGAVSSRKGKGGEGNEYD